MFQPLVWPPKYGVFQPLVKPPKYGVFQPLVKPPKYGVFQPLVWPPKYGVFQLAYSVGQGVPKLPLSPQYWFMKGPYPKVL